MAVDIARQMLIRWSFSWFSCPFLEHDFSLFFCSVDAFPVIASAVGSTQIFGFFLDCSPYFSIFPRCSMVLVSFGHWKLKVLRSCLPFGPANEQTKGGLDVQSKSWWWILWWNHKRHHQWLGWASWDRRKSSFGSLRDWNFHDFKMSYFLSWLIHKVLSWFPALLQHQHVHAHLCIFLHICIFCMFL